MARPTNWRQQLVQAAKQEGVSDPRVLFSLLETQAGDDEIEFSQGIDVDEDGIIQVPKSMRGFRNQATLAAREVAGVQQQFQRHTGQAPMQGGRYTSTFLAYLSQGGPGYDGYGALGEPDTPPNPSQKGAGAHLKRLEAFYQDMTVDQQTGQVLPLESSLPVETASVSLHATAEDDYAKAQARETDYSLIRQVFGPDVERRVQALFHTSATDAARVGMEVTSPLGVFLFDTVADGLDLLHKGGGQIRGALAGRPGEELTAEELTGLEPEALTPDEIASMASGTALKTLMTYPNRAANFGVEMATDPLAVLGGAAAGAKLVQKGVKALRGTATPNIDQAQKAGKGLAAPGQIPAATPGPLQPKVDRAIRDLQMTIDEARKTKLGIKTDAQRLLQSGQVSLQKILRGQVSGGDPAEAAAVAWVRQTAVRRLDDLALAPDLPTNLQKQQAFFEAFTLNARLTEVARSRIEIPAGQTVQAARFGQGPALKTLEDVLERQPEGTPLLALAYQYRLLKKGKERDAFLAQHATGLQKAKGAALQIMLNALIAGMGTPIWNAVAMTSLTGAKVFERWRMSKFADSGVMPGEAGVFGRALVNSYWKLLQGDRVVKARWLESQKQFKGLTAGVNQADLDRMRALETELLNTTDPVRQAEISAEWAALNRGSSPGGGKFAIRRTISKETFDQSGMIGSAIDFLGHTINLPTYIVGKTDQVFRFAIESAVAESLAHRRVYQDIFAGLKRGEKLTDKEARRQFAQRLAELRQHPDRVHVSVGGRQKTLNQVGREEADLVTMMQPLQGRAAQADDVLRSSLIGRIISPFFRVTALTAREGISRMPGLSRLVPSVREALLRGGEDAAKAKAQVSTGWALAAMTALMMDDESDFWLSGGGPLDRQMRENWERRGNAPYSANFRHDDGSVTHIPFDRAAPIGNVIAFVTDLGYLLPRLRDVPVAPDEYLPANMAEEIAEHMTAAMVHAVSNSIVASDLRELFTAFADADRAEEALGSLMKKKLPGFVPFSAFSRGFNQVLDGERKAADGLMERLRKVIPGMSDGLPAYHSQWGEVDEIPPEGAWETALTLAGGSRTRHAAGDPRNQLIDMMDRARVAFGAPSSTMEGVDLSTEQYELYKKLVGKGIYQGDQFVRFDAPGEASLDLAVEEVSLTTALRDVMVQENGAVHPMWARGTSGPAGGRQTLVNTQVEAMRELAKAELLQRFPEIRRQALLLKAFSQVGPEDPAMVEESQQQERQQIEQDIEQRKIERAINSRSVRFE